MSHSGSPAVSVIVACHNCRSYVSECLSSVLAQEMEDFEILAIDDGSTDDTLEVLKALAGTDSRIRIEQLPRSHGGPSTARNVGLRAARGRVITLLDSDDLLEPFALKAVVDFTTRAPDVGIVFFNAVEMDFETGVRYGRALRNYTSFWNLKRTEVASPFYSIDDRHAYSQLVRTNFIRTAGASVPRHVIDAVGPFDESLTNADDWDMWLRIARRYPLGFIDAAGSTYRFRAGNISSRGHRLMHCQIRVLEKQANHASDALSNDAIREQLAAKHGSLAWGLRAGGQRRDARAQYQTALRYRVTPAALRGWFLTWLPIKPVSSTGPG